MRILYSGSVRLDENTNSIKVGRANKFLHFKDMVHFKEQGIRTYYLGEYDMNTKSVQLKGINNFKMKFGGKIVPCYDYYSLGYIIFRKIAAFLGLIEKR